MDRFSFVEKETAKAPCLSCDEPICSDEKDHTDAVWNTRGGFNSIMPNGKNRDKRLAAEVSGFIYTKIPNK